MIQFNNLKEKELLIQNYFCEKTRKELTPNEVFDMWSNWFRNDFRIHGQPVFCVVGGELKYRETAEISDGDILKKYNETFQCIYRWIKKGVDNKNNTKKHFRDELDKERRKEFAKIVALAKPLKIRVILSDKNLYKNQLGRFKLIKGNKELTSGDCDKVIKYLRKLKAKK